MPIFLNQLAAHHKGTFKIFIFEPEIEDGFIAVKLEPGDDDFRIGGNPQNLKLQNKSQHLAKGDMFTVPIVLREQI